MPVFADHCDRELTPHPAPPDKSGVADHPLSGRAIAFGSDDRLRVMAQHPCLSFRPSEPGFRPASESRNPVIKAVRAFTPAVDYWVPAPASPVEPGSLGRDDNPYAIVLPLEGEVWSPQPGTEPPARTPRSARCESADAPITARGRRRLWLPRSLGAPH